MTLTASRFLRFRIMGNEEEERRWREREEIRGGMENGEMNKERKWRMTK